MRPETQDPNDPKRDEAATEPPADEPPESPSEHHGESEEPGGPLGNPGVDEESLRKQQDESREGSEAFSREFAPAQ